MKAKLFAVSILVATAGLASATVTINFSGGAGVDQRTASNFLDHNGGNNARVWGIIVDRTGNGFQGATAANPYDGGFNTTSTTAGAAAGIVMSSLLGGVTDDVLFVSNNLSVIGSGQDGANGVPFLTQIAGIDYASAGGALAAGMSFALVWFEVPTVGSAAADGTYYGIFSHPSLVLPADPGAYAAQDYAAFVQGLDPQRLASLRLGTLIPEPSTALLGAIGALGLLRRRR